MKIIQDSVLVALLLAAVGVPVWLSQLPEAAKVVRAQPVAQPQQFVPPLQPLKVDQHSLFVVKSPDGSDFWFYREDWIGYPPGSWDINSGSYSYCFTARFNGQLLDHVPQATIDDFIVANPDPHHYAFLTGHTPNGP